jgi:hypothetical protein
MSSARQPSPLRTAGLSVQMPASELTPLTPTAAGAPAAATAPSSTSRHTYVDVKARPISKKATAKHAAAKSLAKIRLSREQEEEIKKVFDDYDVDGSGTIEVAELRQIALDLGEPLSPDELEEVMVSAALRDCGLASPPTAAPA